MGMEGFKSPETREAEPPKNKFLELWQYRGRKLESAKLSNQERGVKKAEAYEIALEAIHTALALEYLKGVGKNLEALAEEKEAIEVYINSLSADQVERHIDKMEARWEGFAQAKEEDEKRDEVETTYAAIDALGDIRIGIIT